MLYESEQGDIEFALTGETLMCHKLSVFREPQFLKLIDMLRAADVTFTNSELVFQDWNDPPAAFAGGGAPGGTYMAAPTELAHELKWAGMQIVATANNHASDFGDAGVLTNLKAIRDAGLVAAGTGANLTEASAPAYLDTPKGRVALVAASDWGPRGIGDMPWPMPMGAIAGEQSPYSKGRPGTNLIRHRMEFTVDAEAFEALRRISSEMGWTRAREARRKLSVGWDRPAMGARMGEEVDTDTVFHFMGTKFVLGDGFDRTTSAEEADVERNLAWVRDAKRMADWVLVSFHNHGSTRTPEQPPAHSVDFAHKCIDEGADMYIGHGTGRDRGIEIYKGKPVFLGLGVFMHQNDQVPWVPYEVMERFGLGHDAKPSDFYEKRSGGGTKGGHVTTDAWESIVAMVRYERHELKEIKIHPIDLAMHLPMRARGRPVLAEPGGEVYRRVISRYQKMSAEYGTQISDDGVVSLK